MPVFCPLYQINVLQAHSVSLPFLSFNLSGHRQIRKLQGKKTNGDDDDQVSLDTLCTSWLCVPQFYRVSWMNGCT
jgi:hypothetical protein